MNAFVARVGAGVRTIIRRWESIQVELHGSYSIQRFNSMQKYCETTTVWRAFGVLAAILFLPLICVAVVDIFPLKSPGLGLEHSGMLWIRGMLAGFLESYALVWMFSRYVPELIFSGVTLLLTAIAATTVVHMTAFGLMISLWYPLPFTLFWTSGPWLATLALSLKLSRGDFLRKHTVVQQEVRRFSIILIMQTTTAVVYTGFNALFLSISTKWQTPAALLVPLFRITQKNLFCKYLCGKDDLKPEMVIFNVEVTNALFISSTMQKVESINTSVLLILIDFVQMLISLFDLKLMLKDVKYITNKMGISTTEVIGSIAMIAAKYPELGPQPLLCHSSKSEVFRMSTLQTTRTDGKPTRSGMRSTSTTQVSPTPAENHIGVVPNFSFSQVLPVENCPAPEVLTLIERMTTQERHLLLQKILQILFFTEFLLLTEFMEVLTPVIYSKPINLSKGLFLLTNLCAGVCLDQVST